MFVQKCLTLRVDTVIIENFFVVNEQSILLPFDSLKLPDKKNKQLFPKPAIDHARSR